MDSISSILEIILGIIVLFVSIVWLIFPFIVMNRMREIREAIENGNRNTLVLIQEMSKSNQFLSRVASPSTQKTVPPLPPGASVKFNISKNGKDLGQMDISMIKTMLNRGDLTPQDHYFDPESNEWMTLDCHPDFCA